MTREHQITFSDIFYDTMFGLVIFYAIDGLMDLNGIASFAFYIFSMIIIIHWWLIYKSTDDAFADEVKDSIVDLVIGVTQVILVDYVVLFAKTFNYTVANYFLIALIATDLIWACIWLYVGKWRTKKKSKILAMEKELKSTIMADVILLIALTALGFTSIFLAPEVFVALFILIYSGYMYFTVKFDIIDMKIF